MTDLFSKSLDVNYKECIELLS